MSEIWCLQQLFFQFDALGYKKLKRTPSITEKIE